MAEEKNLENKVKKFLKDQGCWYLKTWSNGVQRSGVPDILACIAGKFVGIELKSSTGRLSELQVYNLRKIEECSGYALVVRPDNFEDFKSFVINLMI